MTSSILKSVKKYLDSQAVTRYCLIYFDNSPKYDFGFRINYILKNLMLKIILFLFHRLSFYLLEKRKRIGGHHTNYLSGGPNLIPPTQISRIIKHITLRGDFLSFTYMSYITCMKYLSIITLNKEEKGNKV